jgi:hypothetical protein
VVQPGFQWIWLRDLPRVLLLDGFFFHTVIARLAPDISWQAEMEGLVGWGALVGVVMILKKNLTDHDTNHRHLAQWLSLCSIALVLFLGFLSVTRYSEAEWAPVTEERYYWLLSPLLLLLVLLSMEDFAMRRVPLKWQRIGVGSILAIGLIVISGWSMHVYQRQSNNAVVQQSLINKLEAISQAERADRLVVFSDDPYVVADLLLRGNFPVYRNSEGQLPWNSRFSRRTTLVWVLKNPENFALGSSAGMRSGSMATKARLFWKTFLPGSFYPQIAKAQTLGQLDQLPSQLHTHLSSSSQLNTKVSEAVTGNIDPADGTGTR